jgi:hypothetical protein
MRKVLLSLLVLALAAPTFAAVNISIVDNANGTATLVIDTTSGEVVRGVALKVTATDGATLASVDSEDWDVNAAAFNTFIDSAFELGGAYNIGAGQPFAKANEAGTAAAGAIEFSISMGVLDQGGNQAGYTSPVGGEALITFKTGAGTICVELDTLRGGIVGDAAIVSNLDTAAVCAAITVEDDVCLGDVNGDGVIDLFNDALTVILALDAVGYADINPCPAELYAADMNGDGILDLFNDALSMILMLDANGYGDIVCP